MSSDFDFDYTAVGHVTVDVLADGSRRAGGTAFYSALQAARLGRRTLIRTRGRAREIEALVEPYRGEIELEIEPARATTTLDTRGWDATRTQRMLAWAGPMAAQSGLDSAIVHLAPVARECPAAWSGRSAFVGLTPQGLARTWAGLEAAGADGACAGGEISLLAPGEAAERLARRCDAIVVNEHERASCEALIRGARAAGAVTAVTAGAAPTAILLADGSALELQVPAIEGPLEDLGAGDVFAAAFFVGLADGLAPARAAAFANAAAAVRVLGAGAHAIGDAAAIAARLGAVAG